MSAERLLEVNMLLARVTEILGTEPDTYEARVKLGRAASLIEDEIEAAQRA